MHTYNVQSAFNAYLCVHLRMKLCYMCVHNGHTRGYVTRAMPSPKPKPKDGSWYMRTIAQCVHTCVHEGHVRGKGVLLQIPDIAIFARAGWRADHASQVAEVTGAGGGRRRRRRAVKYARGKC